MAIPNLQIGSSAEVQWLRTVAKLIDQQTKTSEIADPELLQKIEELKTAINEIEINTDSINLNVDEVEGLIEASNLLLEEIKDNTASSSTEGLATEAKQDLEILELQKVVKNTIKFYTEDVEEDTSNLTTYVGKQSVDGQWMVQKIVDTIVGTITTTTLEYATVVNNATKTTYADAWTDRATLTYSEIKDLI
jgi:hypothetical protein